MGLCFGTPVSPLDRLKEHVATLKKIEREFDREAARSHKAAADEDFRAAELRRTQGVFVARDLIKYHLARAAQHRGRAGKYAAKALAAGGIVANMDLHSGDFRIQDAQQRAIAAICAYGMRNNPKEVMKLAARYRKTMQDHGKNKQTVDESVEIGVDQVDDDDDLVATDKASCDAHAETVISQWEEEAMPSLKKKKTNNKDKESVLLDDDDLQH